MKPFSLSKFTSIVSVLFVTLSGMSAMGQGATTPPPPAGANGGYDPVQSTQLQNTQANKVACTAAIRELGAAITSAKQTCSAAKMTSKGKGVSFNCTSAIEQCEESTSFELPFGLSSTGLGLTSGVGEEPTL